MRKEKSVDKRSHKAAQTDEAAWSIIEANRLATEAKTERLRHLRLARDAAQTSTEPKAASVGKKAKQSKLKT